MNAHIEKVVLLAKGVGIIAASVALFACASIRTQNLSETRYWEPEYKETVTVNTEPPGCKVYCGDSYVGISPVEVSITAGKALVTQAGTYTQQYTHDDFSGRNYGHRKVGATSWGGRLSCSLGRAEWTFRAFRDGYAPATRVLRVSGDDGVFRSAFALLNVTPDGKFPIEVEGRRSILIALRPLPGYSDRQQQQQQQQQTVVMPGQAQGEPEKLGAVVVSANIEDAEILVDGVFVGSVPASLKLKEGIHIIEVKRAGCSTYKRELRVLGGSEVALRAHLERE